MKVATMSDGNLEGSERLPFSAVEQWPPAPEGMPPTEEGLEFGDIREFAYQNGWMVLLLGVITFGIYVPFWMIRTAKVCNKLDSNRSIPLYLPQALLFLRGLVVVSAIVAGIASSQNVISDNEGTTLCDGFSLLVGIFQLFLQFKFYGVINRILERTSPYGKYLNGVATFFFGILYLQIAINRRIRQRQAEVALAA